MIILIRSYWYDHILYHHIDMITLIWSHLYDHIDMITLIWSHWYDHIDMITSNLYILGGSVSIKLSWRLILIESTTIMHFDLPCFAASKGVKNLICHWVCEGKVANDKLYYWYDNVIYLIILLTWSYQWHDYLSFH